MCIAQYAKAHAKQHRFRANFRIFGSENKNNSCGTPEMEELIISLIWKLLFTPSHKSEIWNSTQNKKLFQIRKFYFKHMRPIDSKGKNRPCQYQKERRN